MKSIALKARIYLKILVYFFDGLFHFVADPASRIFSPDDKSSPPEIGVQPYGGESHSKWE